MNTPENPNDSKAFLSQLGVTSIVATISKRLWVVIIAAFGGRFFVEEAKMTRAAMLLAPLVCGIMGASTLAYGQDTKPNIVVILADDLGNADLGYRGSDIKTPNIDRLANDGVRADSFYGMPVCTPARAALMTGRYAMRYSYKPSLYFRAMPMGSRLTSVHCRRH